MGQGKRKCCQSLESGEFQFNMVEFKQNENQSIFAVLLLAVIEDVKVTCTFWYLYVHSICCSNLVYLCRMVSLCTTCERRSACALEGLVCCLFVESGVHALRLRSQNMFCSQSRKSMLFNHFSLLLFAISYYAGCNACWTYTTLFSYLGR